MWISDQRTYRANLCMAGCVSFGFFLLLLFFTFLFGLPDRRFGLLLLFLFAWK